jgi:hypothetical protein
MMVHRCRIPANFSASTVKEPITGSFRLRGGNLNSVVYAYCVFQGANSLKNKISTCSEEGVFMKQTVYTASPESQQIHVWDLDLTGKLTLVQVVDAPGQVQPMVVSPNKVSLRRCASGVSRPGLPHYAR